MADGPRRRRLTKVERQAVYDKMGGRCAYCGCDLPFEAMQADHIDPLRRGGVDDLGNMLPACQSCNHYKSSLTLEGFRTMVEHMPAVLARDSVTYRNAVRFGVVTPTPKPVVFYFERMALAGGDGDA